MMSLSLLPSTSSITPPVGLCLATHRCRLQALAEQYKRDCDDAANVENSPHFPAGQALSLLDAYGGRITDDRERATFWTTVADMGKVLLQVRMACVAFVRCTTMILCVCCVCQRTVALLSGKTLIQALRITKYTDTHTPKLSSKRSAD